MGEGSAVIIKNEGFTALVLDTRIGDAVHSTRLGGGNGTLSLLVSRFGVLSVRPIDTINSKIAESVTEVFFIIIVFEVIKVQLHVGLVIGVAIELRV